MKMASVKVLFCVLLIFYIQNGETIDINTLKLANVMYRHGDRGPYQIFKTDTHQADTWDQGLGYLTQLGMKQQYHLGQYLRNRYQGYLNQTYIRSEFHITSSTVDRCLMSAYCNLAGLFPPTGRQIWNKELLWQPIPVHTVPDNLDNMLSINKPCPLYDKLYKDSYQSKSVLQEEAENKELYKFVSEKSGEANVTIDTSWIISDTLFCEKNHNITWPSWMNETVYNKLRQIEGLGYDLLYRSPVQKRLKGGPLLKQMIKNMKMKMAGTLTEKMMVYSAHDSTIVAFLNNLDLYNMVIPPFTATVMMDLHQENDQYYILLYYKNDTWPEQVNIMTLTLLGCEEKCPFDKFVELTKDKIPGDWDEECKIPPSPPPSSTSSTMMMNTALFSTFIAVWITFYIGPVQI